MGLLAAFLARSAGFAAAPEIAIEGPEGELASASVVAWGGGQSGRTTVPAELGAVRAVAAGYAHVAALKADGSVVAWGRNDRGQATVPLSARSGVRAIATGFNHTVALKDDGGVVAWGSDEFGKASVPLAAQSGVQSIAAGAYHTVALKTDGTVIAWGSNEYEQSTVPPAAQSGVRAIAAGDAHTVALKSDGSVIAWGWDIHGQTDVPAAAGSGVEAIAAGGFHTVALKTDGSLVAWGRSFEGQTNVPVSAQSGVRAIAAGGYHTVALKSDGAVVAWGRGFDDQTRVPAGLSGVVGVAAGEFYTIALHNSSVAFARQAVATPGEARILTIKNTGDAPLRISGVSVNGGDAADFVVNTSGMLSELPPGIGATTFTVTFTPGAPGLRATTLRMLSDDADESAFDIALSGTGGIEASGEGEAGRFTIRAKPVDIDVLANDPSVQRSSVAITFDTLPRYGKVRIIGGKVRYIPNRALPLAGDTFTYRYDDGKGGMGTGTVSIDNFAAYAGQYDGLIEADPAGSGSERHRRSGHLRVVLSKTGALTGAVTFGAGGANARSGASRFGFIGRVDSAGNFVRKIQRRGLPPLTLTLHVDAETQTISGTAESREATTRFTSELTLAKRTPVRRLAGKYELQIDAGDAPGAPDGAGAARVRIAASGRVIVAGRLADGAAFSSAAFLHADESFPLYAALYSGSVTRRGSLRGSIYVPGETSRASTLEWFKPARQHDRIFAEGFAANASVTFTQ